MLSGPAMLLFILLSTIAAGAIAYALLQPRIEREKRAGSRLKQLKGADTDRASRHAARDRQQEQAKRRKTLQNSLKDVEARQKERNKHTMRPSLKRQIEQSGLSLTMRRFTVLSVVAGLACALASLVLGLSPLLAAGMAVVGGLGLPRWFIAHMRKRRQKKFIEEFPNSVDLIVRGIKSGLPLNDTLKMIAGETPEPVRGEFQKIIESQQMGLSTAEAVQRLYQNVPLSETNFFAIVIAIQAQAGGNLSEALGNLSKVLRDRKKMKAKIQAMSMEAKASGMIIGALPFIVAGLVYITTPDYISILFTTTTGNIVLIASGIWMLIGVLVMKKMISFDF